MDTTKLHDKRISGKLDKLMAEAIAAPKANESVEFLKAKVGVIREKKLEAAKGNKKDG